MLARLHGIQTQYTAMGGRRVRAGREGLLAALSVLGAPVSGMGDVEEAFRSRRGELSRRMVEPVVVAWEGRGEVSVRIPRRAADGRVMVEVEEGEVVALRSPQKVAQSVATAAVRSPSASRPTILGREDTEGSDHVRMTIPIPGPVPFGYHTLHVRAGRRTADALLISAPLAAHGTDDPRSWGLFLPLYALRSSRSWGTGDLSDLRSLLDWTAGLRGHLVGTLPLLATFLDDEGPFDPSPYAPASRLFWNELYVDPTAVPGFERSSEARLLAGSPAFRRRLARLRSAPLIDYREAMRAKRPVFEILADELFAEPRSSPDRRSLEAFRRSNPAVNDYARFRAVTRRRGSGWPAWPAGQRDGTLPTTRHDEAERRYHVFVQWAADRQMQSLARADATGLYVDLPLGVHADGYDVWRERHAFVVGASAGAPPDQFFSGGQNWGFPPPYADGDRELGYRYFRACIRHLFRPAAAARIDHVMGLHRVFVIPSGLAPRDGVYVRQRPDELYAILALESRKHRTAVVGEDLGTVPPGVRTAMRRHGIHRSSVLEFELRPNRRRPMRPAPRLSVATVGTHDTPTFAAFWMGLDIDQRLERDWISEREAVRLRRKRERVRIALTDYLLASGGLPPGQGREAPPIGATLRAVLAELAAGPAGMVLVNLEDLWLERRPQNVPGTMASGRDPNWRRPARLTFEEFSARRSVVDSLRLVRRARAERPAPALGRVRSSNRRGKGSRDDGP